MASLAEALSIALDHHQSGQVEAAETLYRRVLDAAPDYAPALRLYGVLLRQTGRAGPAVDALRRALALAPDHPAGWGELAESLTAAAGQDGQNWPDEATERALARVAALTPDDPAAAQAWRQAQTRNQIIRLFHRGVAALDAGQPAAAIRAFAAVLMLDPASPTALINLAAACLRSGQLHEAAAPARRARDLAPASIETAVIFGDAHFFAGDDDGAVAAYDAALRLAPNAGGIHYKLAMALLRRGDAIRGWDEYEWRWGAAALAGQRRVFACPQWDGGALNGRDIIVHGEQGQGDVFHFVRYVRAVAAAGPRRLYLEVLAPVLPVLRASFAGSGIELLPRLASFPGPAGLPTADCHIPLMSLPRLFPDFTPGEGDYLRADPERAGVWAARLAAAAPDAVLRCGLVWAGNPGYSGDARRSAPLAALAPLADIPGATLFSCQVGAAARAQMAGFPAPLIDLAPDFRDFGETAAALAGLDVVICVDTAVAHLAAALGRPVWLLLSRPAEWRWGNAAQRTPWYPSMRLFRQSCPGDWSAPVAAAAQALRQWATTLTAPEF